MGFDADDGVGVAGGGVVPEIGEVEGAEHDIGGMATEVTDDPATESAPAAP